MRYGVRDIVDVTLKDVSTKALQIFLDSLKTSSTETAVNTVYQSGGRGNSRRVAWDSDKVISIKAEDGMISPLSLALLQGDTVTTGAQYVPVTERLTVSSNTITLSSTPYTSDTTNYPYEIYTTDDGSTPGTKQISGNPTNANEFSLAGGVATVNSGFADGDMFLVTYYTQTSATNKRIAVESNKFPKTFELTGYGLWRSEDDNVDYPCRITIPKAKLLGNYTLSQAAEGEPSTVSFNFEVLKPQNSNEMIIFDIDEGSPIS